MRRRYRTGSLRRRWARLKQFKQGRMKAVYFFGLAGKTGIVLYLADYHVLSQPDHVLIKPLQSLRGIGNEGSGLEQVFIPGHAGCVALKLEFLCGLSLISLDDLFLLFDDVCIQRQKVVLGDGLVLVWVSHEAGRPEKCAGPGMEGHGREAGF